MSEYSDNFEYILYKNMSVGNGLAISETDARNKVLFRIVRIFQQCEELKVKLALMFGFCQIHLKPVNESSNLWITNKLDRFGQNWTTNWIR